MHKALAAAATVAWMSLLGLNVGMPAIAATSLIPVEDFTRLPKLRNVTFSPDGQLFAAVQELDGRMALTAGDIKSRKLTRLTSFKNYDVSGYRWISSKRLMFSVYDATKGLAEQKGGGNYAINADGSDPKDLNCPDTGPTCRPAQFMQRIWGSDDEILITANERDIKTQDVYRLNTRTGRKTLLTSDNPGQVSQWFLDKDGVPRAAVSVDGRKLGEVFWYRDSVNAPWRKISSVEGFGKRVKPAAFDSDGTLFVYTNLTSDKYEIRILDTNTGKPGELIAAHSLVDLDSETSRPIVRLRDHKILGFQVDADKPEALWMEDDYAKIQAVLDSSMPKGNENSLVVLDDGRVLVNSRSDRDPGTSYLYDPKAKQMQELLRPMDWIKPEQMSSMQVVRYKARDGLEIPSYLTLPRGKPSTSLPLVAWIHGGPWARDEWRFNSEVQFLASRGYAVFQPNFRGSTGFGQIHLTSSFKKYGQSMQDDITDGIKYLISQGIVDPNRICIGGGSYGGYATMMALVKEPDFFRCGINEAGVTDLIWAQELGYTDFNQGDADSAEAWYKIAIGDVKADRALLEQYSPRLHADKIKAPALIVHGGGDRRVPIKHAEGMRDALQAAGKGFEWVVYPEEGHGFTKPENKIDRLNKIGDFLARHIGMDPAQKNSSVEVGPLNAN